MVVSMWAALPSAFFGLISNYFQARVIRSRSLGTFSLAIYLKFLSIYIHMYMPVDLSVWFEFPCDLTD